MKYEIGFKVKLIDGDSTHYVPNPSTERHSLIYDTRADAYRQKDFVTHIMRVSRRADIRVRVVRLVVLSRKD